MRRSIISALSQNNVIDVYVNDGQSNMVGSVGNVTPPLEYQNPNPNAQIVGLMNSANPNQNEITEFTTLTWGADGVGNTFLGNIHGAEISIAREYGTRPVYFVKVAQGATNLAVNWASGSLLRTKFYEYINYAKQYFIDNNIQVRWIRYRNQWESDVESQSFADAWASNLDAYDIDLFNNTGIVFDKYLHIKVSENPQNSYYDLYTSRCETLLTYLNNRAANESNFSLIDVDDLPLRDEGLFLHQDSAGQITMGQRIYQAAQ